MFFRTCLTGMMAALCLDSADAQPAAQTPGTALSYAAVEDFFDTFYRSEQTELDLPGAVIVMVQGDDILFARGYGRPDAAGEGTIDPAQTLFRTGSVSKLVTWTAVMQQVERGAIDLDADVNTYLADTPIRIPDTFEDPVTMRHLMSHTAGFEDQAVGLLSRSADEIVPLAESLARTIPERVRPAGLYPSYSNWGAALAGVIVEEVSGVDFDTYVRANIFAPLGMASARFGEPLTPDENDRLAQGLTRENGAFTEQPFEFISGIAPAGSLTATGEDMGRFMLAHLNQGQGILRPDTVARMHSRLFTLHDGMPGMAYGFYEQIHNGHRLLVHGGDTLLYHSNLALMDDAGIGIFVSTNGADGIPFRSHLIEAFMDTFYPEDSAAPSRAANVDLAPYAGRYRANRHNYSTMEKIFVLGSAVSVVPDEDALIVSSGDTTARYVPLGDDLFRRIDGEDRIAFLRDEEGEVDQLVWWNAPMMTFYRLQPYQTANVQMLWAGLTAFVFLNIVAGSLVHVRRICAMTPAERHARIALFATAGAQLAFIAGIAAMMAAVGEDVVYGWPGFLPVWLALPVAGAGLTLVAACYAVRAWRSGYWTLLGRIRYTACVVLALAWFGVLAEWNLFGWHLG